MAIDVKSDRQIDYSIPTHNRSRLWTMLAAEQLGLKVEIFQCLIYLCHRSHSHGNSYSTEFVAAAKLLLPYYCKDLRHRKLIIWDDDL
jgi:hypothetical protein